MANFPGLPKNHSSWTPYRIIQWVIRNIRNQDRRARRSREALDQRAILIMTFENKHQNNKI